MNVNITQSTLEKTSMTVKQSLPANTSGPIEVFLLNSTLAHVIASEAYVQVSECYFVSMDNLSSAIFKLQRSEIYIKGSTFHNISSSPSASQATAVLSANLVDIRVTNSSFISTSAPYAAIFAANSEIAVINSTFYDNYGKIGAAITVQRNSWLSVTNCSFVQNNAEFGPAIAVAYNSTAQISHSYFVNNTGEDGGSLNIQHDTKVTINDSSFSGNRGEFGSAISMSRDSVLHVNDTIFHANKASYAGTLLVEHYSLAILNSCNFTRNEAGQAGAISASQNVAVHMENCTFDSNSASFKNLGGNTNVQIYKQSSFRKMLHGKGFSTTSKTKYNNGERNSQGKRIYSNNDQPSAGAIGANFNVELFIKDCKFLCNQASSAYGGALFTGPNVIAKIHSTIFRRNQALQGGVINAQQNVHLEISNSEFFDNYGSDGLGAIGGLTNVTCIISGCWFQNNSAGTDMAVFTMEDRSNLTVLDTHFLMNKAEHIGGILASTFSQTYMRNCSFYENKAQVSSLFYLINANLTLLDSEINNNANVTYNLISASTKSYISMLRTTIFNNSHSEQITHPKQWRQYTKRAVPNPYVPGLIMLDSNSELRMELCDTFDNKLSNGVEIISSTFNSSVILIKSNFEKNSDAGIINMDQSPKNVLRINGGTFEDNYSRASGTVIYATKADIKISGGAFQNNRAGQRGGVIYMTSGNLTITNTTFDSNTALLEAGVISFDAGENSRIQIIGSRFSKNQAGSSGAVMHVGPIYEKGLLDLALATCMFKTTQPPMEICFFLIYLYSMTVTANMSSRKVNQKNSILSISLAIDQRCQPVSRPTRYYTRRGTILSAVLEKAS